MTFSVSSLSFGGPFVNEMENLPKDFGIEIFYEWGTTTYWRRALERIMQNREGGFSVHSPFTHLDISVPGNDDQVFTEFMEAFEVCKKYNAEFYVVHTNGHLYFEPNEAEEASRRALATDRLVKLDAICKEHGIQMVVENLGFKKGERTLFNQKQFLQLFEDHPQLKCLIDTGHAILADYNIYEIQKALRSRIIAYHLHDNNGLADEHLRIGQGIINWNTFAEGFRNFTPNALCIMEYNVGSAEDMIEDRSKLRQMLKLY